MRRMLDRLYAVSELMAGIFILLICALVATQVTLNVISKLVPGVSLTIASYADVAGFMLVGASFMALAPTLSSGEHIRVTLVVDRLRKTGQIWAERFALAVAAAMVGAGLWFGVLLIRDSIRFNDMSNGIIAIPLWIPQLVMVAGLAELLIVLIDLMVQSLRGRSAVLGKTHQNEA